MKGIKTPGKALKRGDLASFSATSGGVSYLSLRWEINAYATLYSTMAGNTSDKLFFNTRFPDMQP